MVGSRIQTISGGGRDQADVWFYNKPRVSDLHPTMKSLELVERAVKNSSNSRDIVLDFFVIQEPERLPVRKQTKTPDSWR